MSLSAAIPGSTPEVFIRLTPDAKRPSQTCVELRSSNSEGPLLNADKGDLLTVNFRQKVLKAISALPGAPITGHPYLLGLADQLRRDLEVPDKRSPFTILLRQIQQKADTATTFSGETPEAALRDVLGAHLDDRSDLLFTWPKDQSKLLACLDVDYHTLPKPPAPSFTTTLAELVRPQPLCWWHSHGGGLHLLYHALDGFDADELAAVAMFHLSLLDASATFEIKTDSRHPLSPRTT